MHDIGCEHADVWSCSGNTYLLEPRTPAGAATRRRVSELEQVGVGRPAGRGGRGRLRVAVVLAVRHGVSKTVERLPLTVPDLTTQASNEFITSYLQAPAQAGGDRDRLRRLGAGRRQRGTTSAFEGDRRQRER
jgi:hypothetical protein